MAVKITVAILAGLVAALGISLGIVTSTIEGNISGYQGQITNLNTRVSQLSGQLASANAKLTGKQPDVITCTDLHNFETNIQVNVNGIDAYGNYQSYTGMASSSWLPQHCYNP